MKGWQAPTHLAKGRPESESEVRSPCRNFDCPGFFELPRENKGGSWLLSKPRQEALLKRLCSFLMTESQRPKLCCARARTPSGRPIVRHKDGLVLHAAARRRRRDTAASHCHRARVCEYGPKHRPRRRKGRAQYVVTLLSCRLVWAAARLLHCVAAARPDVFFYRGALRNGLWLQSCGLHGGDANQHSGGHMLRWHERLVLLRCQ